MHAPGAVLLLLFLAALGLTTHCTRMQTSEHAESTPPYVPPEISQEKLNRLLRQDSQKSQPAPKAKLWEHKVRHRRETLFSIALWYTGSGMNWPRLTEANPDIDPRRIRIGDTVLIPEDLLRTRRPMPADFPKPERKRRKIKKPPSQGIHPPSTNEESTLFGPIENDLQRTDPGKTELPVPLETLD